MPIPVIAVASVYAASTIGGSFLGKNLADKILSPARSSQPSSGLSYFDMHKELQRNFPQLYK